MTTRNPIEAVKNPMEAVIDLLFAGEAITGDGAAEALVIAMYGAPGLTYYEKLRDAQRAPKASGRPPGVVHGQDDELRAALVNYLWRDREKKLQDVYHVEDLLAELGEAVRSTRQRRDR